LGIFILVLKRRFNLIGCFMFSFLLLLGYHLSIYKFIPFVYSQSSSRFIIYLLFFISLSSACFVSYINKHFIKSGLVISIILLCVVWIDVRVVRDLNWLQGYNFNILGKTIKQFPSEPNRPKRGMLICNNYTNWQCDRNWPASLSLMSDSSSIVGHFEEASLESFKFINKFKQDVLNGSLSPSKWNDISTITGLTYLIVFNPSAIKILRFDYKPIIASKYIEPINESNISAEKIISILNINLKTGIADSIPVLSNDIQLNLGTKDICE